MSDDEDGFQVTRFKIYGLLFNQGGINDDDPGKREGLKERKRGEEKGGGKRKEGGGEGEREKREKKNRKEEGFSYEV